MIPQERVEQQPCDKCHGAAPKRKPISYVCRSGGLRKEQPRQHPLSRECPFWHPVLDSVYDQSPPLGCFVHAFHPERPLHHYPAGRGNPAIRRTMLPNKRPVRCPLSTAAGNNTGRASPIV